MPGCPELEAAYTTFTAEDVTTCVPQFRRVRYEQWTGASEGIRFGSGISRHLRGYTAFTGRAGELRAYDSGQSTFVKVDTNGDGKANVQIEMNKHVLSASEFIE